MNLNEVSVETLARSWLDAKRDEDEAKARRQAIAKEICERLPSDELEMTDRRDMGDLRLAITRKLNRSVDNKALSSDWAQLPRTVQETFRWKPEVDLKNLRALEFANPDDYSIAATYITTKPATPSVEVEEVA